MILGANRVVSTYRLSNNTSPDDTTEYEVSATHSGLGVYIESVRPELDLVLGTKAGIEAYTMHADADEMTDVVVGDKVIDELSNEYYVQGIKRHENNIDTCNVLEILIHRETERYSD